MCTITILTPVYNRKELLTRLYESLCHQTKKDFEWLVIDDGSTDGTRDAVIKMKEKADFKICYKRKDNGGKHTALNYAYQFIKSPLTFIVDSDDKLTPDAIISIQKVYSKYKKDKDLCGFSFLRAKPDGGYLSDSGVPQNGLKESYVECRINRRIGGDMAEVWYTDCLREFPFPVFEGEKFLGEDIVWIRMAQKYKMRFFNKIIYISDYLDDGLTNNRRRHNINSPKGCVVRAETFLESDANIIAKTKAILQYCIYGKFADMKIGELYNRSQNKVFYCLMIVPSYLLYKIWEK